MHGSQSMVSTNQGFINPQLISSVHPESPMMIHVKLHMLADLWNINQTSTSRFLGRLHWGLLGLLVEALAQTVTLAGLWNAPWMESATTWRTPYRQSHRWMFDDGILWRSNSQQLTVPYPIIPLNYYSFLYAYIHAYKYIYIYTYTSQTRTQDSAVNHPSQIVRNYSSFVGYYYMIEGSLEVKLPTIWRDEKAVSREKSQRRKDQKKEDAGARKGRKVAIHCVFSWFCGSGGSKSRLAKAAARCGAIWPGERWKIARRCGAKHISKSKCKKHLRSGPLLAVEMSKKCTPLWREEHFKVKMYKTHQLRTTFWSCDVEKVHAVVARSTFPSQNVQNTPFSDHFWKLQCRKSARRCGAKHISKSKCTKHTMLGPLLEVEFRKSARCCGAKHISKWKCTKHTMLGPLLEVEFAKKCTPLWREAHFQVKMHKAHHARTTFWMLRCLHYTTLHYITVLS